MELLNLFDAVPVLSNRFWSFLFASFSDGSQVQRRRFRSPPQTQRDENDFTSKCRRLCKENSSNIVVIIIVQEERREIEQGRSRRGGRRRPRRRHWGGCRLLSTSQLSQTYWKTGTTRMQKTVTLQQFLWFYSFFSRVCSQVNWVQCDACELWSHLYCIGMKEEQLQEDVEFICKPCKDKRKVSTERDNEKDARLVVLTHSSSLSEAKIGSKVRSKVSQPVSCHHPGGLLLPGKQRNK